jgi:predicted nucleic acid-binding protein
MKKMKRTIRVFLCMLLIFTMIASCAENGLVPLTVTELLALGEEYLLDLDYEKALVQFLEIIEVEPMNPRGYTGAAEAYIGLRRPNDAIAVLNRGISILPGNIEITNMLIGLLIEQSRHEEALALVERALSLTPDDPELIRLREELNDILYVHVHDWMEASCQWSRYCMECFEFEGEPLAHIWIGASFQAPQICSLCGETQGDPWPPGFIVHNDDYNDMTSMVIGAPYRYFSCDYQRFPGNISIQSFTVLDSYNGIDAPEGYEFQAATVRYQFDVRRDGIAISLGFEDFYRYNPSSESYLDDFDVGKTFGNNPDEGDFPGFVYGGTISHFGSDYDFFIKRTWNQGEETQGTYIDIEWVFLAPVGYDGFIVVASSVHPNDIDEDFYYFRLKQ